MKEENLALAGFDDAGAVGTNQTGFALAHEGVLDADPI